MNLVAPDKPAGPRSIDTDENGRFRFVDVPPGRYRLSAAKPSYLTAVFGQRTPEEPERLVAVADRQPIQGLSIRMSKGAVITGTLLDETGRPMSDAAVVIRRSPERWGIRMVDSDNARSAITNDRGVYRFFGLPPGDYVVAHPVVRVDRVAVILPARDLTAIDIARALASEGGGPTETTRIETGDSRLGYTTVYYPGVTSPSEAGLVHVEPGEERTSVDFSERLVRLPPFEALSCPQLVSHSGVSR